MEHTLETRRNALEALRRGFKSESLLAVEPRVPGQSAPLQQPRNCCPHRPQVRQVALEALEGGPVDEALIARHEQLVRETETELELEQLRAEHSREAARDARFALDDKLRELEDASADSSFTSGTEFGLYLLNVLVLDIVYTECTIYRLLIRLSGSN